MTLFGLVLMLIGFLAGISLLWTVGLIITVIGIALWALGSLGHEIGGRRHYY